MSGDQYVFCEVQTEFLCTVQIKVTLWTSNGRHDVLEFQNTLNISPLARKHIVHRVHSILKSTRWTILYLFFSHCSPPTPRASLRFLLALSLVSISLSLAVLEK